MRSTLMSFSSTLGTMTWKATMSLLLIGSSAIPALAASFTSGGLGSGVRGTASLDACNNPNEAEVFFSTDNAISFTCTNIDNGQDVVATGIGSSALGVLHASTFLNITLSTGLQFGSGVTVGSTDTLSFLVLPGHEATTATMFTRLHGGADCPTEWSCGGLFQVSVSNDQGLLGSGGVSADANSPVAQTTSFSFALAGNMTLATSLSASVTAGTFTGQGGADFGSTASITGVQVFDAQGNDISEFSIVSFGGNTLSSGAPADESTPEPGTWFLAGSVVAGMLIRGRLKARRVPLC